MSSFSKNSLVLILFDVNLTASTSLAITGIPYSPSSSSFITATSIKGGSIPINGTTASTFLSIAIFLGSSIPLGTIITSSGKSKFIAFSLDSVKIDSMFFSRT